MLNRKVEPDRDPRGRGRRDPPEPDGDPEERTREEGAQHSPSLALYLGLFLAMCLPLCLEVSDLSLQQPSIWLIFPFYKREKLRPRVAEKVALVSASVVGVECPPCQESRESWALWISSWSLV